MRDAARDPVTERLSSRHTLRARALQGASNFALYSSSASSVYLVLFSHADLMRGRSTAEIRLDPVRNRTGLIWHIALPDIARDYLYGAPPPQPARLQVRAA